MKEVFEGESTEVQATMKAEALASLRALFGLNPAAAAAAAAGGNRTRSRKQHKRKRATRQSKRRTSK